MLVYSKLITVMLGYHKWLPGCFSIITKPWVKYYRSDQKKKMVLLSLCLTLVTVANSEKLHRMSHMNELENEICVNSVIFCKVWSLKAQYVSLKHWSLMTPWRRKFTNKVIHFFFINCTFHFYSNSEYITQRMQAKNIYIVKEHYDLSLARV